MSTISVPLPEELIEALDSEVLLHRADSRAGLIRRIIADWRETQILSLHRKGLDEYKKGEYFEGDLDELVKGL